VAVQPAESKAARDARIANYTCCPRRRPWYPIIDVLPQTATPLPLVGLLGLGLLTVAAGLAHRRRARR
jgi:LPXTG-motif cell wall-anchored protein